MDNLCLTSSVTVLEAAKRIKYSVYNITVIETQKREKMDITRNFYTNFYPIGGIAQWLGCRSMVDSWPLCG